MKQKSGWIKLHRQILEWEWYNEPNTFRLFFHLLMKANHKPMNYKGITIKEGQVITGQRQLSKELNISRQEIRTAMKNLLSTHELTHVTSRQGTVIQIVNFKKYQVPTHDATHEQPTSSKMRKPVVARVSEGQKQKKSSSSTHNNKYSILHNNNIHAFSDFWNLYNKKVDRKKCEAKFKRLNNKEVEMIFKTLPNYLKTITDKKYQKNPLTYLNGECWNDEIEEIEKNEDKQYSYLMKQVNISKKKK